MSRRLSGAAAALAILLTAAALPAFADSGHGTMPMTTHAAPKGMAISATVSPDTMKGYNLHVSTRAFRWAPQHAGRRHRSGEGHAHLYLDGTKLTRLYGSWYYLGSLTPGRHELRVTLNGNDHGDYVRGGRALAATVVVTVPAS